MNLNILNSREFTFWIFEILVLEDKEICFTDFTRLTYLVQRVRRLLVTLFFLYAWRHLLLSAAVHLSQE